MSKLSRTLVTCPCILVLALAALSPALAENRGADADFRAKHSFGIIQPRPAFDLNRHPGIVEVVLHARRSVHSYGTGNLTEVWTYNGSVPGPMIRADVGDKLIVHFFNSLPEETTIHWHGVELPANMDGSNIAQEAVEPGGYFRYEFDLLRPALYWYHPHIRSNEQIEKGLYGTLLVRDRSTNHDLDLPWRQHVLVLDDVLLDDNGQVEEPFPLDPLENAVTHVNGREGNTLLVNGRANAHAAIRRGVPHRMRLVNTSNVRFMRVSIPDHTLYRIGGDLGLLEAPLTIEPIEQVPDPHDPGHMISDPDRSKGILLTPGERADVVFTPHGEGPIHLEWHDVDRGRHRAFFKPDGTIGLGHAHDDGARPPETLMTIHLYGHDGPDYTPPAELRDIEPFDITNADPLPPVTFGHTQPDADGNIIFFVQRKNGMPLPFPAVTPADAPVAETGETRIFEVHNLTGGDHNFHLHGFALQLLETQFVDLDNPDNDSVVSAPYLEDKDTLILPARPGAAMRSRTISRIAVKLDDTGREGLVEAFGKVPTSDASGGWVFHCHLLEHVDNGMMSFLQVLNP